MTAHYMVNPGIYLGMKVHRGGVTAEYLHTY